MKLKRPSFKKLTSIKKAQLSRGLIVAGVLVLVLTGLAHIYRVNTKAENVFWSSINNAMKTRSVSATFIAESDQRSESYSILNFSPNPAVQVVTKSFDSGDQTVPASVTHNIGTPSTDYLRFIKYQAGNQYATPEQLREVENVWTSKTVTGDQASDLLYNQYIYTFATNFPVIFANLNDQDRAAILNDLKKDTMNVDFDKTKIIHRDGGRLTYGYVVSLNISGYIKALQAYGKATGYTYFDQLEAERFKDAPPITFEMIVDVVSKQVVGIENNGVAIRYSSFGVATPLNILPKQTITSEELQKRQENLQ